METIGSVNRGMAQGIRGVKHTFIFTKLATRSEFLVVNSPIEIQNYLFL